MGHHQLDSLDEQILRLIADNARIPFLEVARACNVSGAAIHQRIQKLTNLGILKGSEFVIDPEKIGYETCAYIGLYLKDPEQFDSVTEGLRQIPEVVECHFTTGQYDMFIKIYAKNNHHLLDIIHDKLQPLGLSRSETIISFREAIKRQMPILDWRMRKINHWYPADTGKVKDIESALSYSVAGNDRALFLDRCPSIIDFLKPERVPLSVHNR